MLLTGPTPRVGPVSRKASLNRSTTHARSMELDGRVLTPRVSRDADRRARAVEHRVPPLRRALLARRAHCHRAGVRMLDLAPDQDRSGWTCPAVYHSVTGTPNRYTHSVS